MIELAPFTGWLTEVLVAVLAALLMPTVYRLFDRIGVERDSVLRKTFDENVHRAIELAIDKAGSRVPDSVDAKNRIVAEAANWVGERFPDLVKRFKLTPEEIADSVRARLSDHLDRD